MIARRRYLLVLLLISATSLAAAEPERPHGWLGVLLGGTEEASVGKDSGEEPLDTRRGVRVRGIVESSPAEQARIRAKDLIVGLDGSPVSSSEEFMSRLRRMEPDAPVTITVLRGRHELDLHAQLATRPARGKSLKMVEGWLGIEAIDLPPSLRDHFGAPETAGIMVSSVAPASPAEDAGIRVGDVIYEADGRPVTSLAGLSRTVSQAGIENAMEIVLTRNGSEIVVEPLVARLSEEARGKPTR